MNQAVLGFDIPKNGDFKLELPKGAVPLSVEVIQHSPEDGNIKTTPRLYVKADPQTETETIYFRLCQPDIYIGADIEAFFVGSFVLVDSHGGLAVHLFRITKRNTP